MAGMFPRRATPLRLRQVQQTQSQSQSQSQSPSFILSRENLLEAVRSALRGSAQGVTGWRYEHLSFFFPRDGSSQARILRIATCLAAGDAPVGFLTLLAGGRCFALRKDAQGSKVRPIVVGDVLRRLVECYSVPPAVYYVALHVRLGLSIPEMWRAGVCACGAALDVRGHHAQKYPNGGGVVWRHEQVKGAFMEILRGLRHTHVLEETTFGHLGVATDSRLPDRRHKQVDIFASLSTGDTMVADVSVTFRISFDAARLRTRAKTAGAAARTRSEEKTRKYAAAVHSVGLRFIPLVFESFGRPDKDSDSKRSPLSRNLLPL
uniref:Uncharacterized protein n=1 Tax=Chromera velia CCMP2878 TaxID=1169474 RepID=A0A0G4IAD5_9ALVE|eukprot:Cvel_12497.t1-p1 / transcript=Cvel_12497.t1 / gene=Cvel_12497 / organism=Chromera_velia_CCMP2878 / gene_product=hypothetical protein / transcript_product=hypothetical protein / location=Cvel_scaffold820:6330-8636(+) / protein_length=319 / sequence_SO=supercontig / SO=protein_coding / is_pseudo=false